MGLEVTIYTRNNCAACAGTKAQFTKLGVAFKEVNIEAAENGGVAQELVDAGWRTMPVVFVQGYDDGEDEWWSGSRPENIRAVAAGNSTFSN